MRRGRRRERDEMKKKQVGEEGKRSICKRGSCNLNSDRLLGAILVRALQTCSFVRFNTGGLFMLWFFTGLVPRPHPLTRRNDLVNQVEFLGHAFATV